VAVLAGPRRISGQSEMDMLPDYTFFSSVVGGACSLRAKCYNYKIQMRANFAQKPFFGKKRLNKAIKKQNKGVDKLWITCV